jgi:hypothetical protein
MTYDSASILDRVRRHAPRRAEVYDFIAVEIEAGRGFPSLTAIDANFGWKNSAWSMLSGLCADGLLFRFYSSSGVHGIRYGLIKEAVVQEPYQRMRAAS